MQASTESSCAAVVGSACRHVESIKGPERRALVPGRCGAGGEPQRRLPVGTLRGAR